MRIVVVGAGIAGCTLGRALAKAGIQCEVIDLKPAPTSEGGAFLSLAPNGVNALRSLGLGEVPYSAAGFEQCGFSFYNAAGKQIAQIDGRNDLRQYGAYGVVLRRARLHSELENAALQAGVQIRYGRRVASITDSADEVAIQFDDGTIEHADIVIAADGVWSQIRRSIWPDAQAPLYAGIIDCGGWARVDLPDTERQQMHFGRRAFFGYTVKDGTAYWFSNIPVAQEPGRGELASIPPASWLRKVCELHQEDAEPIRRILAEAETAVGAWPLYNMPALPVWHTERICLIGDAAHAVNPSAGQGASLAIEDAVVLAMCLRDLPKPSDAFQTFSTLRKKRAEKIVKFGRQIGDRKVASTTASWFRDLSLPFFLRMGAKATAAQCNYHIDWSARIGS